MMNDKGQPIKLEIVCTACDCAEVVRAMPARALLAILQHWIERHAHGVVHIRELVCR